MKYILLASLLSTAAFASPLAGKGKGNNGAGAAQQAGAGTANAQAAQGGQAGAGQAQQQGAAQNQNAQQQGAAAAGNGATPSADDLATAVSNWMADTSVVSNFLNTGGAIQNNVAFKAAALKAFNAEVDELDQKAVIDQANGAQPEVIAANSTLVTGGAFQDVVDKLQLMSQQGRAAVANIDLINQNRCVNVLPNIDAYMASTGDTQSAAVRPDVCDNTGVAGGVQGNGPTQPGDAPGTPQDAFAANDALVAGTGDGTVVPGSAAAGGNGTQGGANAQQAQGQANAAAAGTGKGKGNANAQQAAGANAQQAQGQADATQAQAGAAQGQAGAAQAQDGTAQGQAGAAQAQAGAAQDQTAAAQGQAGAGQAQAGAGQAQAGAGQAQAGAATQQAAPAGKGKGKGNH